MPIFGGAALRYEGIEMELFGRNCGCISRDVRVRTLKLENNQSGYIELTCTPHWFGNGINLGD